MPSNQAAPAFDHFPLFSNPGPDARYLGRHQLCFSIAPVIRRIC